ncbi:MAG: hypothetical protein N3D18_13725 [Roseococcus sp.]|nr:hypothetical protein [Roseococcus sp.]
MRNALATLALSIAAPLAAALWPVPGRPVLLALPPGAEAVRAFGEPDWRVQRLAALGPLTLVSAAPERPEADPLRLARITGALFAILAAPGADCTSD